MPRQSARRNKYCRFSDLGNESDVEQFFVLPLLADLGYGTSNLATKKTVAAVTIGKGKKRRSYSPDYLAYTTKAKLKPVLIVDAKHPDESADEGVHDAQLYASVIRRQLTDPKPDQYCVGVNGHSLVVKHYESDATLLELSFDDFADGNPKWLALHNLLSRQSLASAGARGSGTSKDFAFQKPDVSEIRALFEACHDVIWKREFESPVPAFWEFCKLMFI